MKSCKNFRLYEETMTTYTDMHALGIWVEDVIIPSVEPQHVTESVEGRDGLIPISTTIKERPIKAILQFEVKRGETMVSFNRKIFEAFNPMNKYHLVVDDDTGIRYTVRVSSGYEIDELSWEDGKFEVNFVMFDPFSESTSLNISKRTVAKFAIVNNGNVKINPRRHKLSITLKGTTAASAQIKNLTTGDVWRYTGTTTASDTIQLEGIRSTKNNLSIVRQTNLSLITLAPGRNEFEIIGVTNPEITFEFREKYL